MLHGQKDHLVPSGQVRAFYDGLAGPTTLRIFTAEEGAEERHLASMVTQPAHH